MSQNLSERTVAFASTTRNMLIGGTRDRIFFMQARARALLPQARAETLEDATDFVAEQEPERFASLLTGFIAPAR